MMGISIRMITDAIQLYKWEIGAGVLLILIALQIYFGVKKMRREEADLEEQMISQMESLRGENYVVKS